MNFPIYEPGQAAAYCLARGWIYSRSGNELLLKECPFCGKPSKFYLNDENGAYSCKAGSCNSKGNFYQLQKATGGLERVEKVTDKSTPIRRDYTVDQLLSYELDLELSESARAYLTERGITMETAKKWHLGLKHEPNIDWLMIPYLEGSKVKDVKYRSLPPAKKTFKRAGIGGDSVLFGSNLLGEPNADRILYMVEGEIDAITMWQHGLTPVVSTTAGAGTFKSQWYDLIKTYDPSMIVICYDDDEAGQKGADAILAKFSDFKCLNVTLTDAKDANEYFLTRTVDDFHQLVANTKPIEIEDVYSMATVLDRLERQMFFGTSAFDGLPSQFEDINKMAAGGFWNGQLITISGPSGTGKTSLVMQEALKWSEGALGVPGYLLCLEMPVEMMMRKVIEHKFGIPMLDQTQADIALYRKTIEASKLLLGQSSGKGLEEVLTKIRNAVHRYDMKYVAFDNINYFVRTVENEAQEIARTMKAMKELAKELMIPIIMIAQPRKFDDDARAMLSSDLKGSGALRDDSDTIILLHRQRNKTDVSKFGQKGAFTGNMLPYTLVRVDKARYSAGGETYLYFDGSRSHYRPLTEMELNIMRGGNRE